MCNLTDFCWKNKSKLDKKQVLFKCIYKNKDRCLIKITIFIYQGAKIFNYKTLKKFDSDILIKLYTEEQQNFSLFY